MDGKIVYKSTSEFLKYISDKAKGKAKSKNQMTKFNKTNKPKKSNPVHIPTGNLNFQ